MSRIKEYVTSTAAGAAGVVAAITYIQGGVVVIGELTSLGVVTSIVAAKALANILESTFESKLGNLIFPSYYHKQVQDAGIEGGVSIEYRLPVIEGKKILASIISVALMTAFLVKICEVSLGIFATAPAILIGGLVLHGIPKVLSVFISLGQERPNPVYLNLNG